MTQPTLFTPPAERAARERIEAVYAAADRLSPPDLRLTTVPWRDMEEREVLLADLERTADTHRRGALLDEARGWLRDALSARAVARWTSEAGVSGQPIGGRAEDQAQILLALEDTVSVAVVEDLLDPDASATLANPGRRILGLEPLTGPAAGAPDGADGADRADVADAGPDWAPSDADWALAAVRDTTSEPGRPPMGTSTLRAASFAAIAVIGGLAAMAWGISEGPAFLGALVAIAVVFVCWIVATRRRR